MSAEANAYDLATQRAMIENTLCRYAWAFDMAEIDVLAGCFTHDARVEFLDGDRIGRDAVREELERRRARYPEDQTPWHLITNIYIRPGPDACVRVTSWYGFSAMSRAVPPTLTSFGWYDDRFVFEEGDWLIADRRVLKPNDR